MFTKFVASLVFLTLAVSGAARAESAAVCQTYAHEAVEAFHESQRAHCGFSSARFQDNYNAHYGWCLAAPPEWVRSETLFRTNELNICKGDVKARICGNYAKSAVEQQNMNVAYGCGFTGARWQPYEANHLGWCLGAPLNASNPEYTARAQALQACINPPAPQPPANQTNPSSACNVYVTVSTTQCYNVDGTPSQLLFPSVTVCGPDVNGALHNAAVSFASSGVYLSDYPVAGACTYTYQVH